MKYDVIAIGSGVGLAFINNALANGLKCALIEKDKFGGTCLTRGCIPSKILIQPADIIRSTQHAEKYGLTFAKPTIDFKHIAKRMWDKIGTSGFMKENFEKRENLDVYSGVAEFIDNHTIKVTSNTNKESNITGDKIIIACGARSFVPNITGLEETGYITYETFYGEKFPEEIWKDTVIIGGGVIGTEFAHMLSAYGSNVTIVELTNCLLPQEDIEISMNLVDQFTNNGINVLLNSEVISVCEEKQKKVITINNKGKEQKVYCDEIIMATGIRPNSDITKIDNTDIKMTTKGWIETNEYLETSVHNIWAIGDINGKFQFRHKANFEMFTLVDNVLKSKTKRKVNYNHIPWAIFTYPQIAHVGLTEEQALKKHSKVLVGKLNYSSVAKGYAMGFTPNSVEDGLVKIILSPEMRIIGVHIIGPYAAMLIQSYVTLMTTGCICSLDGFTEQINKDTLQAHEYIINPLHDLVTIHPALSEVASWAFRALAWVES